MENLYKYPRTAHFNFSEGSTSDDKIMKNSNIFIGKFDEELVKKLAKEIVLKGGEGLVVRNFNSFNYDEFSNNIAKFVRANHVQTENNWANTTIKKNELKKKEVVL